VGAAFRRTVNLTVLSARANREFAVRLTALVRPRNHELRCESQIHPGGRDRGAVEGNCVAAMRGGEQPGDGQLSQTKVNSIRRAKRASLLAKGEACRESGELVHGPGTAKTGDRSVGMWLGWERLEGIMGEVERSAPGVDRRPESEGP